MCRCQWNNTVLLAHMREEHRLSLDSYGRAGMTEKLKESVLNLGHRCIERLMKSNNINVIRIRKYKVTTDSVHNLNVAPNLLDRNFHAGRPNQKWVSDISHILNR